MKITKFILLLLLVLFAFISCDTREWNVNRIVSEAETIVEEHPDSVLHLLDSIGTPQRFKRKLQNKYKLLQIQAKDKAFKDISSDTAIFEIAEYYEKRNSPVKTALSYFYCARVCQEQEDNDRSMYYYMKAREFAKKTSEDRLKGLIEFNIGGILYDRGLKDEAVPQFKEARNLFRTCRDYKREVAALSNTGAAFLIKNELDSAFYYYNQALEIAKIHNDLQLEPSLKQEMGVAFREKGDIAKAKECFFEALSYTANDSVGIARAYLGLARTYESENMLDSATYYLQHSILNLDQNLDQNDATLSAAYRSWSRIEEKKGNLKEALELHHRYSKQLMAVLSKRFDHQVLEVQKRYDLELVQNEKDRLKIEKQSAYLITLILLLGILFIYILYYRKKVQFNAAQMEDQQNLKEAHQKIQQLNELAENLTERGDSYHHLISHHLDILKKVALLHKELDTDNKKKGHYLLEQFNLIVYENKGLDWNVLYKTMNEKYDGTLDELRRLYQDILSDDELKICCLTYDRFSNPEISIFLECSIDTVQAKKTVIRKKIGMERYENLYEFLYQKVSKMS